MLKISATLFLLFFTACHAVAQQPYDSNRFGSQIGISLGGDIEMPHGLDYRYLLSTAHRSTFDDTGLPFSEGELISMECDNPTFRFQLNLSPVASPETVWQISLLSIDGRIDKVRYELDEDDPRGWQFLEVSATNKETAVEVAFLKKSQATKALSFHAGISTNVGYSHGGKVEVKGYLLDDSASDEPAVGREINQTFNQKNSINQRLFLQAGMGIRFLKKMEVGFDMRKGLGYRASLDGPFNFTLLKRSIGLNLRYSFI